MIQFEKVFSIKLNGDSNFFPGYLKPAKRLGVFPKVSLAVILGLVVGRVSYHNECMKRMKQLPGNFDMKDCFMKRFKNDKIR